MQQIRILHLSDLHFGEKHRFLPPAGPDGSPAPPDDTYPTLHDTLLTDLARRTDSGEVVMCITGDLTQKGAGGEYSQALRFVKSVTSPPTAGAPAVVAPANVFVVPGNHDLKYGEDDDSERWSQFMEFYREVTSTTVSARRPKDLCMVHDRYADLGLILVTLNSCTWVKRGTVEEERGNLDITTIGRLESELERIPAEHISSAIKVAMVHHHPVLLPIFVEPGKNYDSVANGDYLVRLLRKFRFHLLLHGHKHDPYVFTLDPQSAMAPLMNHATTVVAGGSAGSTELSPGRINTYNLITVKWNSAAAEARVTVETRGLRTSGAGEPINPTRWEWTPVQTNDKLVTKGRAGGRRTGQTRAYSPEGDGPAELERQREYKRLRGNLPVVEVVPSLAQGQHYEAHLWLERHWPPNANDLPVRVEWAAGPKFDVVETALPPGYRALFAYFGSMIVQARLHFSDGDSQLAHVYARVPNRQDDEESVTAT